ncbi:MAG: exosortase F system-associated protein [Flavobacteriaceae bacterium]|nr:exosortase F system-associated protein [Bacteroidia bacterium]MBT8288490.1 exosortase F system-associated protein [Bacteroidia bacterium]NNF75631.1 exosortase F system-associated protein [Flavobacteriaceae bacterium]NNK71619.1 exosortase F system-associated protein [Flavobacteriaceae bacterium]
MSNSGRYILIGILIVVLAMIRYFENDLFYDPYLQFFKSDYLYIDSPRRETFKLTAFTTLRYLLNSLISLGIIFLVFKDKGILKFASLLYFLSYIILILIFLYFVINPRQDDYYLFFNIRRFLIQPLILLILLPAFYYYKIKR